MQVILATTEEGQNVPVIDVTNPAFAIEAPTDDELSKIAERSLKVVEAAVKMKKNSRLLSRNESYYTGMKTYFNKLGAENLHDSFCHRIRQKNGSHTCTNRHALAAARNCSTFGRQSRGIARKPPQS